MDRIGVKRGQSFANFIDKFLNFQCQYMLIPAFHRRGASAGN